MQDPNPMPWGAQDKYQAHFIVRREAGLSFKNFVARTVLETKGHFGSKTITAVRWNGPGSLAARLNGDEALNDMIKGQSIKDATIYVEPTDGAIRIRGKWDNHLAFGITKEMFEIYDKIASHVKAI